MCKQELFPVARRHWQGQGLFIAREDCNRLLESEEILIEMWYETQWAAQSKSKHLELLFKMTFFKVTLTSVIVVWLLSDTGFNCVVVLFCFCSTHLARVACTGLSGVQSLGKVLPKHACITRNIISHTQKAKNTFNNSLDLRIFLLTWLVIHTIYLRYSFYFSHSSVCYITYYHV